ncbi:MAG: hypothetical protein AB7F51_15905 [Pseudorhodoplanes sp.]
MKPRRRLVDVHPNLKDARFGAKCCRRLIWGEDAHLVRNRKTKTDEAFCFPTCDRVQCAPPVGRGAWPERRLT